MQLFDSHFHFYGETSVEDYAGIIRDGLVDPKQTEIGTVDKLFLNAVGADFQESLKAQLFAAKTEDTVFSCGVHPHSAEKFLENKEDFERFLNDGCKFSKRKMKIFKKVARLRAVELTPKTLLTYEHVKSRSELSNPEIFKLLKLALKLVPTTLCMLLTISIIPTLKEDMTASAVIEGILKLSSLPVIAFRGYSAGYFFARRSKCLWIETKARLLEAFCKEN